MWLFFSNSSIAEVTGVDSEMNEVPLANQLTGNYPNPFNPTTTISFALNTDSTENTELEIFNAKGQKVKSFPPSSCHPEPDEGRHIYRMS